jgi:hypothetical protein
MTFRFYTDYTVPSPGSGFSPRSKNFLGYRDFSTLEGSIMPPFPFPGRPPTLSLLANSEPGVFWGLALSLQRNLLIFLDSLLLPA